MAHHIELERPDKSGRSLVRAQDGPPIKLRHRILTTVLVKTLKAAQIQILATAFANLLKVSYSAIS